MLQTKNTSKGPLHLSIQSDHTEIIDAEWYSVVDSEAQSCSLRFFSSAEYVSAPKDRPGFGAKFFTEA